MTTANNAVSEQDMQRLETALQYLSAGGTFKSMAKMTDEELEIVYAAAYNHFTAHKYDKAIELFKFLCLYDHTQPRWFYGLGVAQQSKRDYEAAVNTFAVATILDIEDPRPQAQAGYCLMALAKWPEAMAALEGAIMMCGDKEAHAEVRKQAEGLLETVKANIQKK